MLIIIVNIEPNLIFQKMIYCICTVLDADVVDITVVLVVVVVVDFVIKVRFPLSSCKPIPKPKPNPKPTMINDTPTITVINNGIDLQGFHSFRRAV